jgi:Fe2+ or Zn2+ uptake regulation protein
MDSPAEKKERSTRQRRVILGILSTPDYHPTAEELCREARRLIPKISLGTVYRNLAFLRDAGKVREIRARAGESSRYEAMRPLHAHFHCSACLGVHDVPLPVPIETILWGDESRVGRVTSLELHVVGLCSGCFSPSPPSSSPPSP